MHFDLVDLRLYLNVLQAGNITAGASLSHLSLPAASARIRAMEASLGVAFLQRSRRGISPTPAGQALAQHARLLLQQVERMNHDLSEYAQGFKGRIRLLCNTAALTEYLPELLADFVRQHPAISVDHNRTHHKQVTFGRSEKHTSRGRISGCPRPGCRRRRGRGAPQVVQTACRGGRAHPRRTRAHARSGCRR